jgi:hypothetical protein
LGSVELELYLLSIVRDVRDVAGVERVVLNWRRSLREDAKETDGPGPSALM